jgi:hypothetical protein
MRQDNLEISLIPFFLHYIECFLQKAYPEIRNYRNAIIGG